MGFITIQNKYRMKRAKFYTWLIKSDFGGIWKNSIILPPFQANDAGSLKSLFRGDNCSIWSGGWIEPVMSYVDIKYEPRIEIDDTTDIGRNSHIIARGKTKIGKEVVIADNVYITDNLHGYENINIPILDAPLVLRGIVTIDDQVYLGERVCVMPGDTIGRHSILGCNSVTKDIPPYSVAIGSPARVIKRYDFESDKWIIC